MKVIELNRVLNKERKYYGLKLFGLLMGLVVGMLAMIIINMTVGIIAGVIGYLIGAILSGMIHRGKLQRWLYRHTLMGKMFGGKYLPPSHQSKFI